MRPDKNQYYCNIARDVAARSTCVRRKYGAVIVNNDCIISTGYNGAPRGQVNCSQETCIRAKTNVPHGERYELCRSVHAEQNAIIHASYRDMQHASLYLAGIEPDGSPIGYPDCCDICKRMIINAGIEIVYFMNSDGSIRKQHVYDWVI